MRAQWVGIFYIKHEIVLFSSPSPPLFLSLSLPILSLTLVHEPQQKYYFPIALKNLT